MFGVAKLPLVDREPQRMAIRQRNALISIEARLLEERQHVNLGWHAERAAWPTAPCCRDIVRTGSNRKFGGTTSPVRSGGSAPMPRASNARWLPACVSRNAPTASRFPAWSGDGPPAEARC